MTNAAVMKEANEKLRASAIECIDNGAPVQVPELSYGSAWAQGDVALWRHENLPAGASRMDYPKDGQIAPGESKGSRHQIAKEFPVEFYRIDDNDDLSDIFLVATGPFVLAHPEHADCTFQAGIYRVCHEQNEMRERVLD